MEVGSKSHLPRLHSSLLVAYIPDMWPVVPIQLFYTCDFKITFLTYFIGSGVKGVCNICTMACDRMQRQPGRVNSLLPVWVQVITWVVGLGSRWLYHCVKTMDTRNLKEEGFPGAHGPWQSL